MNVDQCNKKILWMIKTIIFGQLIKNLFAKNPVLIIIFEKGLIKI